MKYPAPLYAEAFLQALEAHPRERHRLIENFGRVLQKNGDSGYSKRILSAIWRELVRREGGRWVIVEYAREPDGVLEKAIHKSFWRHDHIEERIRPELVAGARITIDGEEELDYSFHRKLTRLFTGARQQWNTHTKLSSS